MKVQARFGDCHTLKLPRMPSSVSRIESEGISNSVPQVGQRLFFLNANSHIHFGAWRLAGVYRHADVAANAVFKKLRDCGYEVFLVHRNAEVVEGKVLP